MGINGAVLFAALAAPIVAVPAAQDQGTLRTITIHTDDVVPESQPQSLTGRLAHVEGAIRARVVSSQVRAIREDVPPGVDPAYGIQPETEQTVRVLEILKDSVRFPIVGMTMTVTQPVGTVVVDGVRVVKDLDKLRPWSPGDEVVLLLKWDQTRSGFVTRTADDSFLLTSGVVWTNGHLAVSKAQRGVAIPEFLARIRSAASAVR